MSRYLLFRLILTGEIDVAGHWCGGGVRCLAKKVGYSWSSLANGLEILVAKKFLVKGQRQTGGRPADTYSLGRELKDALSSKPFSLSIEGWILRILKADEEPFSHLSKQERCFLAQLWLQAQVDKPRSMAMEVVLSGVGTFRLAKQLGVSSPAVQKMALRLHRKGFIYSAGAPFTPDGATTKTKAYFLLGPESLSGWAKAFTWRVEMDGFLRLLAADSCHFHSSQLLSVMEERSPNMCIEWRVRQQELLSTLDKPACRFYVLTQLCAAVSKAFAVEGHGFLWKASIPQMQAEMALLKVVGGRDEELGKHHSWSGDSDDEKLDVNQRALVRFVEHCAILAVSELEVIFPSPVLLLARGARSSYLNCYPIEHEGRSHLRVDVVFDNQSAGDNFEADLLDRHRPFGLPLLDQLKDPR